MPVSPVELLIVLAIVLVIFGPKRLPGLGRSLGGGLREFKDSLTGHHDDVDEAYERREVRAADPVAPREPAAPRQADPAPVPPAAPPSGEQERRSH